TFSITCTYPDGTSGTTTKTFAVDKSSCPSATPSPTPTPTGGGGGGGGGGGTGSCHWQNPDERQLASCACSYDGNRSNLCHVCAPAWQEGDTQYTDAQWTAWDNLGLCRPSCPAIDPYQTERTMPNGSQFPLPQGCVEKPSDCPDGYHAFGDTVCQPNATSTATPTATPIPTASPTATPSATPTATPSASPTATPTTSPTGIPVPLGLTLTVGGANLTTNAPESTTVSATDGQIVSVIAILSNPQPATGQALTNVLVQASLPAGIAYIAGTTTIDGATAPDGVVNTGITLASIGPSQFHRTVFNVKIDASMFPVGSSQAIVRVNASASGITPQSGQLIITITKGVVQPGAVQTGPADAVLLAFLVSAVTTLLYVSYTHTSVYRRHELEQFGRERGPLDFRS
ncbi:MAG TPA: hypothetical protein VMU12_03190, partial [Candidatus Paceibacterota bacterium]|nr:hypothetical protein [Candidatus Paceibacterota bacterium]